MRKNVAKVLSAFLAGKSAVGDAKHTISTDGSTIFSYDMPIARRFYDGSAVGVTQIITANASPSRTTTTQIHAIIVFFVANKNMYKYEVVPQLYATEPHKFKKVFR